jgi:hypothetical protein
MSDSFLKLPHTFLYSPAVTSLTDKQRLILFYLMAQFNGSNGDSLSLTFNDAVKCGLVKDDKTYYRNRTALEDKGLITQTGTVNASGGHPTYLYRVNLTGSDHLTGSNHPQLTGFKPVNPITGSKPGNPLNRLEPPHLTGSNTPLNRLEPPSLIDIDKDIDNSSPNDTKSPVTRAGEESEGSCVREVADTNSTSSRADSSGPHWNPITQLFENVSTTPIESPAKKSRSSNTSITPAQASEITPVKDVPFDPVTDLQVMEDFLLKAEIRVDDIKHFNTLRKILDYHNKDNIYTDLLNRMFARQEQLHRWLREGLVGTPPDSAPPRFTNISTRFERCRRGCGLDVRLAFDSDTKRNVTIDKGLKLHRCPPGRLRDVSEAIRLAEDTIPPYQRPTRMVAIQNKSQTDRTGEEERLLIGLEALLHDKHSGEDSMDIDQDRLDEMNIQLNGNYRSPLEDLTTGEHR